MTRDSSPDKSAGARLRGLIQRGETGNKVPGFDSAAAPYETDSEAGGMTQPVDSDLTLQAVMPSDSNAASSASPLRAWREKGLEAASKKAPLREGPAYLIWWSIIAALVMGYLAVSWVWQ